jgi:hypothetical protein
MTPPADADQVLSAVRLGWCLAEVRGRNRPGGPIPSDGALPTRAGHVLPLRVERTPTELRIETQAVVAALAAKLSVDTVSDGTGYSAKINDLAAELHREEEGDPGQRARTWSRLAETIYEFDAHTQDCLTSKSDTQACGYQLGRGLSESYWELDPMVSPGADSAVSWWYLLGSSRCNELSRLAGRLSAYFNPYSAPAIAGSLQVWKAVATERVWREQGTALIDLYQQLRRWYELIVLLQDPSTLVKPYALVRNFRATWKAVRVFWPQLAAAAIGLGSVVALIVLISNDSKSAIGKAVLGAVGVAGLSAATVTAKLKSAAQALFTRLRQDVYTDLVAEAVTTIRVTPTRRMVFRHPTSGDIVAQSVKQRAITPATPAP